jgi:hypothetical protein
MLEILVSRAANYFPGPPKFVHLLKRQVALIVTCGCTNLFLQNVPKENAQYFSVCLLFRTFGSKGDYLFQQNVHFLMESFLLFTQHVSGLSPSSGLFL